MSTYIETLTSTNIERIMNNPTLAPLYKDGLPVICGVKIPEHLTQLAYYPQCSEVRNKNTYIYLKKLVVIRPYLMIVHGQYANRVEFRCHL